MKYFRNTELAKLYHVSEKSVRNWIQASLDGKHNIQLYEEKGKSYVANTSRNTALIEQLVQKGKKYKNTRGFKAISPKKEFYETYSRKQILDIISHLTIHCEIPREYGYFDGGADAWNQFTSRLSREEGANVLTRTIDLFDMAADNIDKLLSGHQKVNVIDLGPGNGLPVRPVLERLQAQGRLWRYVAVDVSQDMLNILTKNIRTWFGDTIEVETHLRDLNYERFDDLFADDFEDDGSVAVNLVFFLGGTLSNFRSPRQVLQTINNSLGLHDLLVYTGYLDTARTRRYFDFSGPGLQLKVPPKNRIALDLLNIDESLYEVEQVFNEEQRARTISIRPTVDLLIRFELPGGGRRSIELRKDEPILLWRHRHYSALDIISLFDENGLDLMQATKSKEQDYILLLTKIKTSGQ